MSIISEPPASDYLPIQEDTDSGSDEEDEDATRARTNLTNPSRPPSNSAEEDVVPAGFQVVEDSQACKTIENMLTTYYTPLEVWYTRSAIEKV